MNGSRVNLFKLLVLLRDGPVAPAIEIFPDDHRRRFIFLVAHLDFDVFLDPFRIVVNSKIDLTPFADDIERATQLDLNGFIFWRVIDQVFTDKFQ